MTHPDPQHHAPYPEGLAEDLARIAAIERRRRVLGTLAGFGAVAGLPLAVLAQSRRRPGGPGTPASSGGATTTPGAGTSGCATIPSETAGPYPGDGTNSANGRIVNALAQSGIVRNDIRSSFGGFSGTAPGVPLAVTLKLVNVSASCTTLNGYAIYAWHCDRDGKYSLYDLPGQNWLRGIWVSDSVGSVTFTTIFPGCYSGRWPHIHFEVFTSLAVASSGANAVKTSQLALPAEVCAAVYNGASGYASSAANFARSSLAGDNVFGNDGAALQLASLTGSVAEGYAATLTVGI